MRKKNIIQVSILIMLVVSMVGLVNAIGLSKEYYEGYPIKISPGDTKEVVFAKIIVTSDEGDRQISIEMVDSANISRLVSEESFVAPAGSRDKEVRLSISVPKEDADGKRYDIIMRVKDATVPAEGGMVSFTQSSTTTLPVVVEKIIEPVKETEKPSSNWLMIFILIIILIIILIVGFFWYKKSRK